jgi:hypothetical protein
VSQPRTAFTIAELLHLELKCPDCEAAFILPIKPLLRNLTDQPGQAIFMYCPWCNNTNIAQHAVDVRSLLSSLLLLKDSTTPLVHFVFQSNVRDTERELK